MSLHHIVCTLSLFVLFVVLLPLPSLHAHVNTVPFSLGDVIELECRRNQSGFLVVPTTPTMLQQQQQTPIAASKNDSNEWGPGIICHENGRPLSFQFGTDGFLYCGWFLSDEATYQFAQSVMKQDIGWNCRVPMSADKTFYLPVLIPLWGIVEASHLHLNYHMNFIFHVAEGRIVGVSSYPLRDRFQFGRVGSLINLHGPVRWFQGHSFQSLSGNDDTTSTSGGVTVLTVVFWCLFCIVLTCFLLAILYVVKLKPMLVKRYLKGD